MFKRANIVFHGLAASATMGAGAFLALQWRADPLSVAVVLLLVGLGLAQAFAVAFAASGDADRDAAFDSIAEHIVVSVRRFLAAQRDYGENLTGLNSGLSQLASRSEVQDIIVKLMNRNMEMQARVDDLSRNLEKSQQQIVNLRNNVTEVGKIAMTDALTELGNRRFFDQTFATEVSRAKSRRSPLCLAIADVDHFKLVNDRFGHTVGDQLLRLVAELLAQHARDGRFAARYGGEEFALLFPNTGIDRATAAVEKIRRELEMNRWVVGAKNERLGVITASFGVAELGADESAESLIDRADRMLFDAKQQGRNRVVSEADGESASTVPSALAG